MRQTFHLVNWIDCCFSWFSIFFHLFKFILLLIHKLSSIISNAFFDAHSSNDINRMILNLMLTLDSIQSDFYLFIFIRHIWTLHKLQMKLSVLSVCVCVCKQSMNTFDILECYDEYVWMGWACASAHGKYSKSFY